MNLLMPEKAPGLAPHNLRPPAVPPSPAAWCLTPQRAWGCACDEGSVHRSDQPCDPLAQW
jgi:hypothetical protein